PRSGDRSRAARAGLLQIEWSPEEASSQAPGRTPRPYGRGVRGLTSPPRAWPATGFADRHSAGAVGAWGQQRRSASRPLGVGSSDRRSASEQVAGRDSDSYLQDTPKTHSADGQLDYFTSSELTRYAANS